MSDEIVNLGGPTVPPTEPVAPAEPTVTAAETAEMATIADELRLANEKLQAAGVTQDQVDHDLDRIKRQKAQLVQGLGGPARMRELQREQGELDSLLELSRRVGPQSGATLENIRLLEQAAMDRGDQAEVDRLQRVKLAHAMGR